MYINLSRFFINYLKLSVNSLKCLKIKFIYVLSDQIFNEISSMVLAPLVTNCMDIRRMNRTLPTLKNIYKLQFSKLLYLKRTIARINTYNINNLFFSLVIIYNFQIQIYCIKSPSNKILQILYRIDFQSLKSFLLFHKIFDNFKLFPLDKNEPIFYKQIKGFNIIIDSLLQIDQNGQHISRRIKINNLILYFYLLRFKFIIEVFIEQQFKYFSIFFQIY